MRASEDAAPPTSSPRDRRRPAVWERLLLATFGTLLGLVLAELGLRVAAPFWSDLRGGVSGRQTVLCVGDSHTYGLHVPAGFDYPARLQAELDPGTRETGVINRGVPGRNSSALLAELPRYLEETAPDVVLILVGFNDTWNFDATSPSAAVGAFGKAIADLRISKLLRLIRMNLAGRAKEDGGPQVVHRDGRMVVIDGGVERPAALGGSAFGVLDGEALTRRVRTNLEAMIARCQEHGATPVLLTYATENQPSFLLLNENAREVAKARDVPLIEVAAAFRAEIDRSGYEGLFFPDDHPNTSGNALFAKCVADGLSELGLVRRIEGDRDLPADPPPTLRVTMGSDLLRFEVQARPRRPVQVILSGSAGPPFTYQDLSIPLGAHELIRRCLESTNLRGQTDADGRCTLSLEPSFLGADALTSAYAVAVCFPPGAPPSVSAAVAFSITD